MQWVIRVSVAILLSSSPVLAGPWLRDPSLSFLSLQATPRDDGTAEFGLFAERGVTDRLTLGVDVNDNGDAGHALAFARLPIHRGDWVAAVDLGLGGHRYKDDSGGMARLLFGLGRNVQVGDAPGWFALSVGPEWRQDAGGAAWKADGVLGLSADRKVNPILGVETFLAPNDDFYWSAIPGVTVRAGQGKTLIFGVERRGGPSLNTLGFRTGIWFDF